MCAWAGDHTSSKNNTAHTTSSSWKTEHACNRGRVERALQLANTTVMHWLVQPGSPCPADKNKSEQEASSWRLDSAQDTAIAGP